MHTIQIRDNVELSFHKVSWDEVVRPDGSENPQEKFLNRNTCHTKNDIAYTFRNFRRLLMKKGEDTFEGNDDNYIKSFGFTESKNQDYWDTKYVHKLTKKELFDLFIETSADYFKDSIEEWKSSQEAYKQYRHDLEQRERLVYPMLLAYRLQNYLPEMIEDMENSIQRINTEIGAGNFEDLSENPYCGSFKVYNHDKLGKDYLNNAFAFKKFATAFIKIYRPVARKLTEEINYFKIPYSILDILEDVKTGNKRSEYECLNQIDIYEFEGFNYDGFFQYIVESKDRWIRPTVKDNSVGFFYALSDDQELLEDAKRKVLYPQDNRPRLNQFTRDEFERLNGTYDYNLHKALESFNFYDVKVDIRQRLVCDWFHQTWKMPDYISNKISLSKLADDLEQYVADKPDALAVYPEMTWRA